jgi:hypothetical protein
VTFPCPACKTKLTVDRRKLESPAAAAARPLPSSAPPEDDEGFGAKALIVGNDSPALRQAAKLIGFMPIHMATAQQARDYYMQEFPPVVILNPAQTTAPPLESIQPIIALAPNDRRKSFFILVSKPHSRWQGGGDGGSLVRRAEGPRKLPADLQGRVRVSRPPLRRDAFGDEGPRRALSKKKGRRIGALPTTEIERTVTAAARPRGTE